MVYPPNSLPTNATDGTSESDTTPTAVLTAAEVNATNAAVNDIVAELGSNPSGTDATVAARLDGIESDITSLSGGGGAVSSVVGQTGAVTGTQIVADATVAAALAGKAPLASPALTGTPTVPTAAADTNTTQAASTAFVLGQAGSATPVVNGTAAAGTSPRLARQDHVHPTDTSRAASTHVHAAGDITSGTVAAARLGAGTASASTFLRGDGQWAAPAGGGATAPTDRGAWATATSYAVRDVVTEAGVRYECAAAHTSGTFSTDLAASRWVAYDVAGAAALGNTPPPAPGVAAAGSAATALRSDAVIPSAGLYAWFGDASDGDLVLDGSSTVAGFSRSGSVYTATRSIFAANLTVNSGVTLNTGLFLIHVNGTLINNGTVTSKGGDASGATAGAAVNASASLNIGGNGAAGGTGNGAAGQQTRTATNANPSGSYHQFGGSGGAGGSGATGTAGAATTAGGAGALNTSGRQIKAAPYAFTGLMPHCQGNAPAALFGGSGGSAGGGDGTNSGGGGGAGGGPMVINAKAIVNNGTITSAGGAGGTPPSGNCGGGGGGGGGPLFINTVTAVTGSGSVTAAGGNGGSGVGTGAAGAAGSAGYTQSIVWA